MTLVKFNAQQEWDDLYEAAVFELNPTKLLVRVELARKAIQSRMSEIGSKNINAGEERRLLDANRTLEMLLRIEKYKP